MSSDPRLFQYYEQDYGERERLFRREGRLELARTQELLRRYLPPSPARVIDVGGGTGVYAGWLASLGYDVHLLDIVPGHVREAKQMRRLAALVGDARALPVPDGSYDVALVLGPLYHLLTTEDRLAALQEARRVVKRSGMVAAAFISRGGVALDGYVKGWIDRPGVIDAVRDHMRSGISPDHARGFGTIAYFHLPAEAHNELLSAGLEVLGLFGLEGPGWVAADFEERWQRPHGRDLLLESARICETEPELQVLSPHLLGICRRV